MRLLPESPPSQQGRTVFSLGHRLLLTLLFNTLIALGLTAIGYGGGLWVNLVFSHAIGLSILTAVTLVLGRRREGERLPWLVLALLAGSLFGTGLASLLTGRPEGASIVSTPFLRTLGLGVVFGGLIIWFFLTREWMIRARADLRERQLREVQSEKRHVEARLRMLQAQVEPHFLFNTLAHLMSLIDTDAERGKRMLGHLIDYLRTSLQHARRRDVTLQQELDVVDAYLGVLAIRMGDRLRVVREIDDQAKQVRLPPMLLQPLVENAIKHGLEPRPGPGELRITARREGAGLCLEVADNGAGLGGSGDGTGHGLANLRERLRASYGDEASVRLTQREAGGALAAIYIPEINDV